jgi:hypothetical protein
MCVFTSSFFLKSISGFQVQPEVDSPHLENAGAAQFVFRDAQHPKDVQVVPVAELRHLRRRLGEIVDASEKS